MASHLALLSLLSVALAAAAVVHPGPTVALDDATFIGSSNGVTDRFSGIPYARRPIGDLRLRHPIPVGPYSGYHNATAFGFSCPQQTLVLPSALPPELDLDVTTRIINTIYDPSLPQSEDCLNLNVWTPSNTSSSLKLPVVVWIHGGGFEVGSSALYDGSIIVQRSMDLGEPLIFVSMNYRLSALGWLPGREAQQAGIGNLGHRDQRLALQWVQKYIHAFGGDPAKVTIWGESAGSCSVLSQMVAHNGEQEGLFRGAYMESGSIVPLNDMRGAQIYYDTFVSDAGCDTTADTLECLRHQPFDKIEAAMHASPSFLDYQSIALAWGPRVDGDFFQDHPYALIERGAMAKIPVVITGCEDEGSLFVLSSLNITSAEQLKDYLGTYFFPSASQDEIEELLDAYPSNPSQGSPFNTGDWNVVTPQSKRIAAILGDIWFEMPRKQFLKAVGHGTTNVWTSITRRRKDLAILGSAHVVDLFDMFGPSDMTDHLIHFVNYLDPNGPPQHSMNLSPDSQITLEHDHNHGIWPKYDAQSRLKLVYLDGPASFIIEHDTEREMQINVIADLWKKHQIP